VSVWLGLEEIPPAPVPAAVSIGVFDGVHRGHQALLARNVDAARAGGLRSVAVTFDPHPAEVVRPDAVPAMLATLDRRVELLTGLGVDSVAVVRFDRAFSLLSPEEFFRAVLVERLGARAVLQGENFRFGHRGAGDLDTLRALAEPEGISVQTVGLAESGGVAISSTEIRRLLGEGDVGRAAELLGRPHRVPGKVVRGDGRGRGMGYPTANLDPPPRFAVPADGVYAGYCLVAGQPWPAAISVGVNPTFGGSARQVEAYLLDADVDLYGMAVELDFVARLRGMVTFGSAAELARAIEADVAATRTALARAPAAGC
jgi:riboflavin kinase/FMN adenylyltransferase